MFVSPLSLVLTCNYSAVIFKSKLKHTFSIRAMKYALCNNIFSYTFDPLQKISLLYFSVFYIYAALEVTLPERCKYNLILLLSSPGRN